MSIFESLKKKIKKRDDRIAKIEDRPLSLIEAILVRQQARLDTFLALSALKKRKRSPKRTNYAIHRRKLDYVS